MPHPLRALQEDTLTFSSMKKNSENSSGGPSQDDGEGEGEEETNELKDVMLPKMTHEMSKLGGFFEETDDGKKKLRPPQFLNVEIEECINRMNDLKEEIQGGYSFIRHSLLLVSWL